MFDITFASSGRASTQGIKLSTNDFIGRLSVMQHQYQHKRRIIRAKTNRSLENQKDVFRLISLFLAREKRIKRMQVSEKYIVIMYSFEIDIAVN